jgi:hypothetical protein
MRDQCQLQVCVLESSAARAARPRPRDHSMLFLILPAPSLHGYCPQSADKLPPHLPAPDHCPGQNNLMQKYTHARAHTLTEVLEISSESQGSKSWRTSSVLHLWLTLFSGLEAPGHVHSLCRFSGQTQCNDSIGPILTSMEVLFKSFPFVFGSWKSGE